MVYLSYQLALWSLNLNESILKTDAHFLHLMMIAVSFWIAEWAKICFKRKYSSIFILEVYQKLNEPIQSVEVMVKKGGR